MKQLQTGQFYGQTNETIQLNDITLTDTEYTHSYVDWHYHENAYFTFLLKGSMLEGNKKEVYNCPAGSLLFHHWQEPHYNIKPEGYTRGFHIELTDNWWAQWGFNLNQLQGSIKIANVDIKLMFFQLFNEVKIKDEMSTTLAIQSLIFKIIDAMLTGAEAGTYKRPTWVDKIEELLFYESPDKLTLEYLSKSLDIHPVHLSRDFSKYFACNLGEYLRKLKVEKAYQLITNGQLSLTQIAYECGFADQSHFIRCFKSFSGISPLKFRKLIS